MTDLKKAAQQALEALGCWVETYELGNTIRADIVDAEEAITALKAALEQPERAQKMRDAGHTRRPTLREMAEPEQEPVAWACFKNGELQTELVGTEADVDFWCSSDEPEMQGMGKGALYTAPPRQWQTLSDEEIYPLYNEPRSDAEMVEFARAVEEKLRAKNSTLACIPAVPPV